MTCLNPTTEEVIEGYKRQIARKKRDIAELEKQIYLLHKIGLEFSIKEEK